MASKKRDRSRSPSPPFYQQPLRANPEMIAQYGHVAVLLRRYIEQTGMRMLDFAEHVLGSRHSTIHYLWISAKGVPGEVWRQHLESVIGVPARYLLARDPLRPASDYPPEPTELRVPESWTNRPPPQPAAPPRGRALVPIRTTKLASRPVAAQQPHSPGNGHVSQSTGNGRRELFAFRLYDDNTTGIQLMADLPAERGKALLRVLLDIGLTQPQSQRK